MTFGIFDLLGYDEARRARQAWRPSVLLAMEEVSLAFYLIEKQRQVGEIVSRQNVDRITAALAGYFQRSGRPRGEPAIRSDIETWLAAHSAPDAETVSPVSRKVAVQLPLWHELHAVNEEVRRTIKGKYGSPSANLGDVGLMLRDALDGEARYDFCTPLNCRDFASTGGDGVHFSLLVRDDSITDSSPVVMTLPANCGQSLIVGDSLRDFLCLGIRYGYFCLEQLAYNKDVTLRAYAGPLDDPASESFVADDADRSILALLQNRLQLAPWTDLERFDRLQDQYLGQLKLPPDMADSAAT